jgi:hypothetical protein
MQILNTLLILVICISTLVSSFSYLREVNCRSIQYSNTVKGISKSFINEESVKSFSCHYFSNIKYQEKEIIVRKDLVFLR